MNDAKYIGLDVHQATISAAVQRFRNYCGGREKNLRFRQDFLSDGRVWQEGPIFRRVSCLNFEPRERFGIAE
jgi:hypothetical protein